MRWGVALVWLATITGCGNDGPDQAEGCGDGVLDPGEACDGPIIGGLCEECEPVCWPTWSDCNGNSADGCEAELAQESNCGACGVECGATQTCVMGACAEVVGDGSGRKGRDRAMARRQRRLVLLIPLAGRGTDLGAGGAWAPRRFPRPTRWPTTTRRR